MENKKKIGITILIIVIIAAVALATVSIDKLLENIVQSGTVKVEKINLQLKDLEGNTSKEIADWEPGDVSLITWNVKNSGTAAVYTRNKLQIYWNEDITNSSEVIYLYPANMSKQEILEDFNKGEESQYAIDVTRGEIILDEKNTKIGIEYNFLGDVLDGTKMQGNSKEVNYNSQDYETTTDDTNNTEDAIAFNLLFSPKTSYLFEGKSVTIKVLTEAMQYTEAGKAEWQIVDSQTIGD